MMAEVRSAWARRCSSTPDTVRDHKRRFAASGRDGIERLDYAGHAPVLSEEQAQVPGARSCRPASCAPPRRCAALWPNGSASTTLPNAMAKLLGRLGHVWKRPRRMPAKADACAQRVFLGAVLAPLMAQAEADPEQPLCSWTRRTRPTMPTRPAPDCAAARHAS